MTRHIPLEGIENFRDFGGYRAGERALARGRLYRSAQHTLASDADLAHLSGMGLAAIVDLRRPSERATRPSRRWTGFATPVIEGDDEFEGGAGWDHFMRTSDHSPGAFHDYLMQFYAAGPFVPRHVDLFARYFEALARADGPILVHCAGGKDRTGMICALTHALAGVHEDDMMADFLATNDPVRLDKVGPVWAKEIGDEYGREPTPEALRVAMSVEPDYLHTAFSAIRSEYGSIDAYLEKALGVDPARRAAIERKIFA